MRRAVTTALAGLALAAIADPAAAQSLQRGRFTIMPSVGLMHWDNASALANKKADDAGVFNKTIYTPSVGLTATYNVTNQIGAGFYFEAARAQTRGDYFPAALFNFGASLPAELRVVSQRVTVLMYGLQGSFDFNVSKLQPYVSAGIGAVTVNGDPQQTTSNASFTTGQFQIGGGIGWQVSQRTAIRLDARDFVFTSWDRNDLNPVAPAYQNTAFPAANGVPPAAKNTVHNLRIALGFTFVPRRAGDEGATEAEPSTQE